MLKKQNICSIIFVGHFRGIINWHMVHRRWNYMKETKEYEVMTNEEYRKEIRNIFDGIQENYKLRWFYIFISEKIKG